MKPPLVIVDGMNWVYATGYHLEDLSFHGIQTGTIYGFLIKIMAVAEQVGSNNFVFCWDSKTSVRKLATETYKNRRQEKLQTETEQARKRAIRQQADVLRQDVLPRIGFLNNPVQGGLEADDMIAVLVEDYAASTDQIIIVSSDQDLYQCLRPNVRILKGGGKFYTLADFRGEFYGMEPADWVWVKCLAGCNSDDVEGIEGVGNATAAKYWTGNLKETHKIYQTLTAQYSDYIKRNQDLVRLPHSTAGSIELVANQLDFAGFQGVCADFGFGSLMEQANKWKAFFSGSLFTPTRPNIIIRRR